MSNTELYIPFGDPIIKYSDLNIDNKTLLKDLKKIELKKTIVSDGTFISKDVNIFKYLTNKDFIGNTFATRIKHATTQLLYNTNITIGNCWLTMTKPKAMSHFHFHANYWLSACYYPMGSATDDYGIEFKRPSPLLFDVPKSQYGTFNSTVHIMKIKEGDFIVFPSYLEHRIMKNNSKINRYSIAMVINPIGKIGVDDSQIEYGLHNR